MLLNLHLLREELSRLNLQGTLHSAPHQATCAYPLLCDTSNGLWELRENVLYIVPAAALPDQAADGFASLLCIGMPPLTWLNGDLDILYTLEAVSPVQVLQLAAEQFYRYHQWERSLQQVIDRHLPVKELAVRSESFFLNPMAVECDGFLQLISHIPRAYADTEETKRYYASYQYFASADPFYYDFTQTVLLSIHSDYETGDGVSAPYTIVPHEGITKLSLYCNYRQAGRLVCRIYIDEYFTPLTPKHHLLLSTLTEYFAKYLGDSYIYSSRSPIYLESVSTALQQGESVSQAHVDSILRYLGWQDQGEYYFVHIKPLEKASQRTLLETYAQNIATELRNNCFYYMEDRLAFILNLNAAAIDYHEAERFFSVFARHRNAIVGFSTVYHSFQELAPYARQASFAVKTGEASGAGLYCFSDLYPRFWIEEVLTTKEVCALAPSLIPVGLQALIAYDQKKHTAFTPLLRIYLEKERNIAATIRAAYLHRNTFLYQLQKMQSILNMDLEDPNIRLTLLLAFQLLEKLGQDFNEKNPPV